MRHGGMQPMSLQRYLALRRRFELGFWLLFFLGHWLANAALADAGLRASGVLHPAWRPLVDEGSRMLAIAMLLPAILAFDRRFPLRLASLRRTLPAHIAATIVYSVAVAVLMRALRVLGHAAAGQDHAFGPWLASLPYDYLVNARDYLGLLAIVYLYRFILLRLQGEASLLAEPEHGAMAEPDQRLQRPQRLLIRKLGKEFLVNIDHIEWLAAAGNYVNLHIADKVYPLRGTMAGIEHLLDPQRFVRVHRGFIVNLDQVAEIEPTDGGEARIRMVGGAQIPFSRRYRSALRGRL
jgi:DNA-binding LytR/AlgR family response regulator